MKKIENAPRATTGGCGADGGGTPSLPGGLCEMRWWSAGGAAKMAALPVNAARSASGPYHGRAALVAATTGGMPVVSVSRHF